MKIDFSERDEGIRQLEQLANNTEKLKNSVGNALVAEVQGHFQDSKSPKGEAWHELKFRSGKPLLDTGALKNSINFESINNGVSVGHSKEYGLIQNNGGVVTPKTKKALWFQGASHPFKKAVIPQRQFLLLEGDQLPQKYKDVIMGKIEFFMKIKK